MSAAGYSAAVWARFCAPGYGGGLPAEARRCSGCADTPAADAVVEIDLYIEAERIAAAAFRAFGCPATVAAADWVCEWAIGRTCEGARGLTTEEIEQALTLTPDKRFCGLLAIDAMAAAMHDRVLAPTA